ncbi:MAG: 3-dehydroquinate synthase [Defluviicoccus sp.]|nr:3-dehydroquinate synthase [Defluviicoccus sp.]MDG4610075.1 3-dehydroquinate synthase [Defluviicoccus sp.]
MMRNAEGLAAARRVPVTLGARSYDVFVGENLLDEAGALLAGLLPVKRAVVITDAIVAPLCLERLRASLAGAGILATDVVLPAGEQTKDFPTLQGLCENLLDAGVERTTVVIALGGGVIGDIAGVAAGIVLRGLPYVQMPTTLLAQVDSSVGGKTAINTRHGKNLVGLFYQPRAVIADTAVLQTLPARQMRAGYAEVVKYGLISDAPFFDWLEEHGARVLAHQEDALRRAVVTSCRAKAAVVSRDEREQGERALLNLGHTFGHAYEAETGFGEALLHGEAVAIGMAHAFALSARLGLCPQADAERVRNHLAAVGLPTTPGDVPSGPWPVDRLLAHMRHDKKVRDGRLTFVLARGIGKAFVSRDVTPEAIAALLREEGADLKAAAPSPDHETS